MAMLMGSQIPLSELPCDCYTAGAKLESLPCYPCHYCAQVHSQWERFKEDADDVVPLAVKNPVSTARHIQPEDDVDQNSELDSTNLSQSTDSSVDVDVENTFELKVDSYAIANSNWITQYSSQELRERQEEDSNLEPIIRWLSQDTEPIPHELYLQSPAVKHLWLCKDQLQFWDNVLFYHWDDKIDRKLVLVVPKSLKEEILQLCHDTISAGHLGEKKTLDRIKRSFLWYGMAKDVKVCFIM